MIQLDKNFSFERDAYGWTLYQWRLGKDKKGNPKWQKDASYYATLRQVCAAIVDKTCGEYSETGEIIDALDEAEKRVVSHAEALCEYKKTSEATDNRDYGHE